MENIYKLSGKYAELSAQYEALQAELDELYEANGGEVTEVTEEMQSRIDATEALKKQVIDDILASPDDYAEIVLNEAAKQRVLEAELKAVKEEQKKITDHIQARINERARSAEWWKGNIDAALRIAKCDKVGGAKSGFRHCIYYQKSASVETNEDVLLAPYKAMVDALGNELPSWMKVNVTIDKAALKKEETLPEGATLNQKQTIIIR